MLSANYNNYIQQPKASKQTVNFQNSFDSANGSYSGSCNNSSLLTAANTLTFNSPPNNFVSSPMKSKEGGNFSKTLLDIQIQQNGSQDDLDFDLHYNSDKKNMFKNDIELLDIDEEDPSSDFEKAIKSYEEAKKLSYLPKRVLNNPINFSSSKSNDLVDSIKKVNFEDSPNGSSSIAG